MKHMGIIGVSSEGAALCYKTICEESWKRAGKFVQPEITMHNMPLDQYMKAIEMNNWKVVASLMLESVGKLKSAGAQFAICPDNTVHYAIDEVVRRAQIPVVNIVDVVAQECKSEHYKKVGLLGTRYVMEGALYSSALAKAGIEGIVPDKADREKVNAIIFDALGPGQINGFSAKPLTSIIKNLKKKGCEAVILGCTELPLIINVHNSPLPVVDTTRLLARKAVEYSLNL